MSTTLYINRNAKIVSGSASGDEYTFSDFFAAEKRTFALRFLKEAQNGSLILDDPDLKWLQASIGLVDARAEGGTLAYQIGDGPSTADNTTTSLSYNHTALALQKAINALPEIVDLYGLCEVVAVPSGYTIYWPLATGAIKIQARKNRVWPVSVIRTWAYPNGDDEWTHEIRLVQAQLESTVAWLRVLPPAPTVEMIELGGVYGGVEVTTKQKLNMPPEFRGTIALKRSDTGASTALLSISDGPRLTQEAVQAIFPEGTVNVTTPGENYGVIEFAGDLAGAAVPLLEVVVGTAPLGDPTFTLNLLRPGVYNALRQQDEVSVYFDVRAYIAKPGAAEDDEGEPEVLFRREVTLRRDQGFDEMLTLLPPAWLQPPNPIDYVPYTEDQVQIGNAYWHGAIGNGVNTIITITHNVGSEAVASLVLRDNISGGEVKMAGGVEFDWTPLNANQIQLSGFPSAPATNSLYLVVMFAIPVAAWQPHTHTIEQVVGLPAILDNYLTRIVVLETVLPSTGNAATSSQASGIVKKLPKTKEVLFLDRPYPEGLFGEDGLDVDKLPDEAPPYLLPAIHNAVVLSATEEPDAEGNSGKVWTNDTGDILYLGDGLAGGNVAVGGLFGSDGRMVYALSRSGTTNSYYPRGFERKPWEVYTNDKEMRVNRTLDGQFGLALQLHGSTSVMQWVLVIEKGTAPQDTTPNPTGINLQNIVWDATPILSQRLLVGPLRETHSFGVRIKRTAGGMLLDTMLYGVWDGNNAAAPADANFALRARLINGDSENALQLDAGAWVSWELIGPAGTEEGESNEAKIIIY